jgi:hypothetical protein
MEKTGWPSRGFDALHRRPAYPAGCGAGILILWPVACGLWPVPWGSCGPAGAGVGFCMPGRPPAVGRDAAAVAGPGVALELARAATPTWILSGHRARGWWKSGSPAWNATFYCREPMTIAGSQQRSLDAGSQQN